MDYQYFQEQHQKPLRDALVVAEEMTSDYFKLTSRHWLRARYDILTLSHLREGEISPHALALVAKYTGSLPGSTLRSASFDFYRVCLQDHNILKALVERPQLKLFPLLCYVMTHELVHIVRFSLYEARFEADGPERLAEEARVHRLTWNILAPLNFLDLGPVRQFYEDFPKEVWPHAHL